MRHFLLVPAALLFVAATKAPPPPPKMPAKAVSKPQAAKTPMPAPVPMPVAVPRAQQLNRIDGLFARWNRPTTPGCALEVAEGGQPIALRAYGSADLEHVTPIHANTVFEAGSVSKQFTAAAILLLVEEGKLRLDDDVRKYVPELPARDEPIQIRHLLNHTSGLRDWGAVAELAGWPRGTAAYGMDDALAIIARQKQLNFRPGAEYSYSNSGYTLAALIVSRVSGMSFPRFTAEKIFRPLGMASTGWRDDFRRVLPGRAIAYSAKGVVYEQDMPFESAYGNGGLLTTVGDLTRWSEALLAGRIGRNVAAELQQRGVLNDGVAIQYARGLVVTRFAGLPEISHAGSTAGYRAWLAFYPSRRMSVALLCSSADANAPDLGRAVASILLGPTPAPPRQADVGVPATVGQVAGLYLDAHDQPLTIVDDKGKLRIAGGGALFPLSSDRFRMGDDSELSLAAPGELSMTTPDGRARFRRIPPISGLVIADYAGRYSSEEVGAAYRVIAGDNEIRLRLENRPQIELRAKPIGPDLFEARGAMVRFRRNAAGKIDALAISIPRAFDVRFNRIE
ncbi:serine hydrolase domain-containing protein [Sphingomonas sp. BIUV-7]|uniref:Serine hydrolase domain-containing protein n=1 Tax=Sphingomonas natans TaxID=3063330 RepID=A0ABT8YEY4_9SPHN|nr:serine hydrolase domain-containing protein [Sphingomonas sp. BIUV-7]MDO6416876.1 serine hydrolase domain-containing protein [Sphingomonas sp. BIUV-7]